MVRKIRRKFEQNEPVYVWEKPVRIYHWVNVIAVFVLCATGWLIGEPIALQQSAEANFIHWFGIVRFVHFIAGFVFLFNGLMRFYWGFVGNKYAKWYNYVPHKKQQFTEIWQVIKVDILQISNKPISSIGHNALADFSYFGIFIAFWVQCLTGFGLYAAMSDSWLPKLFSWIVPILGGDLLTREIHHIFMWVFILFTIVHVYLVFYHDYIERRGVTSSMIGGWKFIEKEHLDELEREEEEKKEKAELEK